MNEKRILHVLQSNGYSGAENVVCQIIENYKNRQGYSMAYCSPDGRIRKALEERGILFFALKKLSVHELRKAIKKYQPTMIHAHDMLASVLVTIAAWNIPTVVHIHGNHMNLRKITIKSILLYAFSRKWKNIIWVSKSAINDYYFRDKVQSKSILLPNIINKTEIIQKASEAVNQKHYDCVVLGRINQIKNPLRALAIFTKVKDQVPDMRIAFIGDGELMPECKQYIKMNNLENNIDMLGFLENPLGILASSKVLVMTSIYEGTPMSALEAMALGTPIVSTPTDGIVDLIEQNQSGVYSEDNNILCEAITRLLTDEKMYQNMKMKTLDRFKEIIRSDKYYMALDRIYTQQKM